MQVEVVCNQELNACAALHWRQLRGDCMQGVPAGSSAIHSLL